MSNIALDPGLMMGLMATSPFQPPPPNNSSGMMFPMTDNDSM